MATKSRHLLSRLAISKPASESELQHRLILEAVHEGIWVLDHTGRTAVVNSRMAEMLGYPVDELLTRLPFDFLDEVTAWKGVAHPYAKVPGDGMRFDSCLLRRDGTRLWVAVSVSSTLDEDNQIIGALVMFTDISERKRAETERARLAAVVESSADAIISKSLDGLITTWNPAAVAMFGYSPAEVIGQPVTMLIPPSRLAEEQSIVSTIQSGNPVETYETIRLRKDGSEFPVSLSVSVIRDDSGETIGAAKIVRDITERKKAEELARRHQLELEHLSRFDAMGKMTAGLSHELNQPLGTILNYASAASEMLRLGKATVAEIAPALEGIMESARRAGGIIRRLRAFVRKSEVKRSPQDVNQIIEESIQLLDADLRDSRIKLLTTLQQNLPLVVVDTVQISQVMVNLIRNAHEAMKSPGASGTLLEVKSFLKANWVQVEVIDRGCGIEADHLASIFEPFFSTKSDGLGMGLAISRSIIVETGGELSASLNPRGGMTFYFTLPIQTATTQAGASHGG